MTRRDDAVGQLCIKKSLSAPKLPYRNQMTFMTAILYLLRSMPFGTAECTHTAPAEVMLILVHASNSEVNLSAQRMTSVFPLIIASIFAVLGRARIRRCAFVQWHSEQHQSKMHGVVGVQHYALQEAKSPSEAQLNVWMLLHSWSRTGSTWQGEGKCMYIHRAVLAAHGKERGSACTLTEQ